MSLQKSYRLFGRSIFSLLFLGTINAGFAEAQVIPDGTLPTTVEQLGNMDRITGGERVGNNLFHSFEQFSIPEGMEAIFENGLDIQNIFTRVTGSEASLIDGLLKTAGGANFFLINPNGIVFGQNARLDIGGSFIATTADRVEFSDGNTFSARSQEKPLLTWNAPIGLGFDYYSQFRGGIAVNGSGNQIIPSRGSTPTSAESNGNQLGVSQGETLALVGNTINLDGATVTGQLELGSVSTGVVNIEESSTGFTFGYDNVAEFSNITIENQSVIKSNTIDTGDIALTGSNIELLSGSLLLIQNQQQTQGTLSINATDSLVLKETSADGQISSSIQTQALGDSQGTPIEIKASSLFLADGARIQAATYGEGIGGELNIKATETIELLPNNSANPNRPSGLIVGVGTTTFANGQAGNTNIDTSTLRIFEGGTVAASSVGSGSAGNLNINAKNIEITGINEDRGAPSSIGAVAFSSGDAGSALITADNITLSEGGTISTLSLGSGDGGTLTINADTINLDQLGQISAAASSGIGGNISLTTQNLNISNDSTITTTAGSDGNGGNITINTTNLTAKKNGDITANALEGDGGNVKITAADTISLNDGSDITAASSLGNGGNITLDADQIQLLDNSNLSASAGGDGNGGNVTTFSNTFLAGNSDVTATAVRGDGGNILIDSRTTIGIAERDAEPDNGTSDADASSEFGRDGDVTITNPQNSTTDPQIAAREPENPNFDLPKNEGCYIDEQGRPRNRTIVYTGRIPNINTNYIPDEIYVPAPGFVPPKEVLEEEKNREEWSDDPWGEYQEWQPGDPIIDSNAIRVDENGDVYAVAEMTPQAARNLLCTPKLTEAEEEIKN